MNYMDLQGQRDLVKFNPPLIFPLQTRVPKYCFQVSSTWWSSFELLLKNDDKNLQDSLGPIDNKSINDSNPETFIYINKTLWKTLRSLYGYREKQKIFIINNTPVKPTIFSRVVLNSQREKVVMVPKSLAVKRFIKLVAKKLGISRKDYVFQHIIGDGYRYEMNDFDKTLEQISFGTHSEVSVKSKNMFCIPALYIKEEEGEDDDFQQALSESMKGENDFHTGLSGSKRLNDNGFPDFDLEKVEKIKKITFSAFQPKFVLGIKSLKSIRRDLEIIEKSFNGK